MIMTRFILFVLFAGKLFNTALPAQNSYTLTKVYSVMILGTSNLRNWKDSIGTVTGNMAADLNIDGLWGYPTYHSFRDRKSPPSDYHSIQNKFHQ